MKDKTHIIYIIDRSGSMCGTEKDVIGGFNKFIQEQKDLPGEASMFMAQFDNEYGPTGKWDSIQDVPNLNKDTYVPRGMTALLDAIGKTINSQGEYLSNISENDRPDKVIVLMMTDGQENDSKEFTKQQIKNMIKLQTESYKWKFVYLGANQDSFGEAHGMGLSPQSVANFKQTPLGMRSMYNSTSNLVSNYRSGGDGSFDEVDRPE